MIARSADLDRLFRVREPVRSAVGGVGDPCRPAEEEGGGGVSVEGAFRHALPEKGTVDARRRGFKEDPAGVPADDFLNAARAIADASDDRGPALVEIGLADPHTAAGTGHPLLPAEKPEGEPLENGDESHGCSMLPNS